MLEIDGSQGEGGGQIVRTSLSLSMLTGKPFRLSAIRAGRAQPGLKRQHLTCVEAAAELSAAQVTGAKLGSSMLEFHPGTVKPGTYHFDIGTAGSCTLVAQTVLLPLSVLKETSTVTIHGGTYNTMAPPFDFFSLSYLPLLRLMGFPVEVELLAPGFYPRGGGSLKLSTSACDRLKTLQLDSAPKPTAKRIIAILADLPDSIAESEIAIACRKLGWKKSQARIQRFSNCRSPGNVLMAALEYGPWTEVVTEFGKQGLPARNVANRLARATQAYLDQQVPVGEHLADQLLLPMGVVAAQQAQSENDALPTAPMKISRFVTGPLTQHTKTHIAILQEFLPLVIQTQEIEPRKFQISVSANSQEKREGRSVTGD